MIMNYRYQNFLKRFTILNIALSLIFSQIPDIAQASNHIDPGLVSGNATINRASVPGETILIYSTVGTTTFAAPNGATNVRVLVVAGGGGGGAGELHNFGDGGGGGGAGGFIHDTSFAVTPGAAVTVVVGAGGAGSAVNFKLPATTTLVTNGKNGGNSRFGALVAIGGGGGGGDDLDGVAGGSGGGSGGQCSSDEVLGGAGTVGQGNSGGRNTSDILCGSDRAAGGGGGAAAAGANSTPERGGVGGTGAQNNITGTNAFYAAGGGGGGGWDVWPGGAGGSSIGGNGGNAGGGSDSNGTNGAANTGSGGGGGGTTVSDIDDTGGDSGAGGSGVVIVRFTTTFLPEITTTSLPDGTVTPYIYSQTPQVTGGVAPYTWATTTGNLPPGLSLDPSTGVISGQATATGTYSFTIQVTDDAGQIDTQNLSIKIVIPVILTSSLSNGDLDEAYSETLEAIGGTTPYTWALATGALPDGLFLDTSTGKISGTPSANGTFTFTVEVTDHTGEIDDQNLSITVDGERSSGGGRGGGGSRSYGCKDESATNYESFASHKQELCKYAEDAEEGNIAPTTFVGSGNTENVSNRAESTTTESSIPAQLFDIRLLVADQMLRNVAELSARVTFTSFGTVPTPVDMTFSIIDAEGREVWRSANPDTITVETEEVFDKDFTDLTLPDGSYILRLHTHYNINVEDIFETPFSIEAETAAADTCAKWWLLCWWWWIVIAVGTLTVWHVGLRLRKVKAMRRAGIKK